MPNPMSATAFSAPSYRIEVNKIIPLDKAQKTHIAEYISTGEIPSRMRACVNCLGSCGMKNELLTTFPEGKTDQGMILGTGCHGMTFGVPAKKVSSANNVSRLQAKTEYDRDNRQHAGYVYKDMILNMKVKKLYVIMQKKDKTVYLKMDSPIVEIDGERQIIDKAKDAKTFLNDSISLLLNDGFSIYFISNSKGNKVIRTQDLRRKIKGSRIDIGKVKSWEEYQAKCEEVSSQYNEIVDNTFEEFLNADEKEQEEQFDKIFQKIGLAEHIKEYSDQNTAISYLFPNQTRSEVYRGLISNNIGEMV